MVEGGFVCTDPSNVNLKKMSCKCFIQFEEINVKDSGIDFESISSEEGIISQGLVPKVSSSLVNLFGAKYLPLLGVL